jgi:cysteinyl-tRNA synthetase
MLELYNSLGRKRQVFTPMNPEVVSLYTCGPTVYDFQHIGNFRKFVFDDTLRRTLEATSLKVKHVMNITDVGHLVSDADEGEDKLEKGAMREGKTVQEVAEFYTNIFKNDAKKLNILEPNGYKGPNGSYARATDFIKDQVDLIKSLLGKNFAYITENAIYFDVSKLPDYGVLSGQKLSDKEVGVREEVVTDSNKRNPQDFAVWFFLKGRYENHSMHWPSPWGEGFPGWHLECSAIIHKLLNDPIDVHTGGVDHIGVHHTNEIAQTEAAYGNKLANYWLHSEHLLVDGQKMSKSLGNFYTLKDVEKKGFDPLALRLLYLQGHYRTQINFTWKNLEAAQNRLKSFYAFADLKHQPNYESWVINEDDQTYDEMIGGQTRAFSDDLDTPSALGFLSSYISHIEANGYNNHYFQRLLEKLDEFYGLNLAARPDITDDQKNIIKDREKARKSQDWRVADELRDKLIKQGVEINDTAHGPIWSRI